MSNSSEKEIPLNSTWVLTGDNTILGNVDHIQVDLGMGAAKVRFQASAQGL